MPSTDVRIKAKHCVKPADSSWKHGMSSHIIALSQLDQIIGPNHTQTIYIYKPPAATNDKPAQSHHLLPRTSIVNTLKDSLSRALAIYYPLAGRLHSLEGARLELHVGGTDTEEEVLGAELIEAETDNRLDDFEEFSSPDKFKDLIPSVKSYEGKPIHEIPLLMVQVTYLGCGGLTLGFSICHTVVDGTGIGYFINDWSRLARGEKIEEHPCHDRTLLRAGEGSRGMYSESEIADLISNYRKMNKQKHDSEDDHHDQIKPAAETKTMILKLTKTQVEKLKNDANSSYIQSTNGNNNNTTSRPFSRYEVLASHVWRSTCKARGDTISDHQLHRALGIAIDGRNRLPSFPAKYFGNAAFIVAARTPVNSLLTNPLGYTCESIREAINIVTEDYVWSEVEFLKCLKDLSICQELRALRNSSKVEGEQVYVNPDPGVLSWLGLKIFELDFGWGKPFCVRPGEHNHDGVVLLLPGSDGDYGSVHVMVSLRVEHIDGFKKYLYEDM